jgi:hypothetical protein
MPHETVTLRSDAGSAVAEAFQHVPNCKHVDCLAVPHLMERAHSVIHGCCERQPIDEEQQELKTRKLPNTFQRHSNIPSASTSTALHDDEMQPQAGIQTFSHARQLQSIPYPVGVATGACVAHEKSCYSHIIVDHARVQDYATRYNKRNCTRDISLDEVLYIW